MAGCWRPEQARVLLICERGCSSTGLVVLRCRPNGLVEWFEELLRRPRSEDAVWLVAEVDGRVAGDVSAHLEQPAEDADRQSLRDLGRVRMYVNALGIAEAYRRRGVGARLMGAVEEWGRAKGAVRSVLTAYHASPLSVPFYEQGMGYERRSIVFEKRLD